MTNDDVFHLHIDHPLVTMRFLREWFPDASQKALEWHIRELLKAERIVSYPLQGRERYTVLSAKSCRALSICEKRSDFFRAQGLLTAYSVAAYCALHHVTRIPKEKFVEWKPALCAKGVSANRYVPTDKSGEIGLLISDCNAHLRALIRKLVKEWEKRHKIPAWQDEDLVLIPIVARQEKANKICRKLPKEICVRPFVLPELERLYGGAYEKA